MEIFHLICNHPHIPLVSAPIPRYITAYDRPLPNLSAHPAVRMRAEPVGASFLIAEVFELNRLFYAHGFDKLHCRL